MEKLRIKILHYEFEAEGEEGFVQQSFEVFMGFVKLQLKPQIRYRLKHPGQREKKKTGK